MVEFRYMGGFVYIFENPKAQRVKIGMTINEVEGRLRDVNRKWLGINATCQVCGTRRLINKGLMPQHVQSGESCSGGSELPLENETALAEMHLKKMSRDLSKQSGTQKPSTSRKIKALEKRIALYKNNNNPVGMWKVSTIFHTDSAEQVELLSHEKMAEYLDKTAIFGEVFSCSVLTATEGVEAALRQLGLRDSAKKEIINHVASEKYGKCVICDGNLTAAEVCPNCAQSFI